MVSPRLDCLWLIFPAFRDNDSVGSLTKMELTNELEREANPEAKLSRHFTQPRPRRARRPAARGRQRAALRRHRSCAWAKDSARCVGPGAFRPAAKTPKAHRLAQRLAIVVAAGKAVPSPVLAIQPCYHNAAPAGQRRDPMPATLPSLTEAGRRKSARKVMHAPIVPRVNQSTPALTDGRAVLYRIGGP